MSLGISTAGANQTREVDPLIVAQRLQREGRWKDIESERDEIMKLVRKRGMSKVDAQAWVYSELDRMYPPLEKRTVSSSADFQTSGSNRTMSGAPRPASAPDDRTMSYSAGQIQGLGDIPGAWPDLPANASLGTEIAWVQANRLRIVAERPGRATVVRLDLALSPAPSWAALGWLETSIRSYAKYVDVAAKVTASDDGEAAVWRRERIAIEEVERLLDEMSEAEG